MRYFLRDFTQLKIQAEEIVILKKTLGLLAKNLEVIDFIRQEREAGHHSISTMCRLLDISRSTYYRKMKTVGVIFQRSWLFTQEK